MDKKKLHDTMIKLEKKHVAEAESEYKKYIDGSELDDTGVVEIDEQSQANATEALGSKLDQQVHRHQTHLKVLQNLAFGPKDEVEEGAVIKFGDKYLVVAIAKSKFEFEGDEFLGISTEAPIYEAIKGLKKGDKFEFNGKKHTLKELY